MKMKNLLLISMLMANADEEPKQETKTPQIQDVRITHPVEMQRWVELYIGVHGMAKMNNSVREIKDDDGANHTLGAGAKKFGLTYHAYQIQENIMKAKIKNMTEEKKEKLMKNEESHALFKNDWSNWDLEKKMIDSLDEDTVKKNLSNLGFANSFSAALMMEMLSNSKSPLRIGTRVCFSTATDVEYSAVLAYKFNNKFMASVSFGLAHANTQYNDTKEDIKFKSFSLGTVAGLKVDYQLSEFLRVYGMVQHVTLQLISYQQVSLGVSHFVY